MLAQTNTAHCLPVSIDGYRVHQLIGSGSQAKVYLCSNALFNQLVSIKVYEKACSINAYKTELKMLSQTRHLNIIRMLDHNEKAVITHKDKLEEFRQIIVLEFAYHGELFNIVNVQGGLSLRLSKFIFCKILQVLKYFQKLNIAHRDIKLQNILFDRNYNIKIIDFGLSAPLQKIIDNQKQRQGYQTTYYKPPQIYKCEYPCNKIDIFAVAFLFFCILFGKAPFNSSKYSCKQYSYIRQGKYEQFWKYHCKNKIKSSNLYRNFEFKELMNRLFHHDPLERPNSQGVLQNRWLGQDIATEEEAKMQIKQKFMEANKMCGNRQMFYDNLHKLMQDMKIQD